MMAPHTRHRHTGTGRPASAKREGPPRVPASLALVAVLLVSQAVALLVPGMMLANGGTLRLANVPMGDYRVSVFTDPTPVRPDTLDVSVLVIQEGLEGVAKGVEVWVRARSIGHGTQELELRATREQADDPRYYAAKFGLGHEGVWEIEVEIQGAAGSGSASFQVTAREWGVLGHPAVIVFLALLPLAGAAFWILRANGEEDRAVSPTRPPTRPQSGV